jgi:hypothetical protein
VPPIPGLQLERSLLETSPQDAENIRRDLKKKEQEISEKLSKLRAMAPREMSELRRLGVDERTILDHLWGTWFACREKTKRLSAVPGVPLRGIKKMPGLLRKLADKVEAINKYWYSLNENHMLMLMLSPFLGGRYVAGQRLPTSLRSFAQDISARLRNRRVPKVKSGTEWKVQTVEFVRETSTDRGQHYELLARLMNAFNEMEDDKEGGTSKRVTPASLKQLWLVHPNLRKPAERGKFPAVEPRSIPRLEMLPPLGKMN